MSSILGIAGKTCILDPLPIKQLSDNVESMVLSSHMLLTLHSRTQSSLHCLSTQLSGHCSTRTYSYRPISNLSHLAKVIEKVVARRILSHISEQRMQDCFQSAYRKNHSTETALLCVINAMKAAMDNRQGTTLVLIDFSAAFGIVNHNIMIRRLQLRYSFVGEALSGGTHPASSHSCGLE